MSGQTDLQIKTVDKLFSISIFHESFYTNLFIHELQIAKMTNKSSVVGDTEINITVHLHGLVYIDIFSTSVYKRNLRTVKTQ